MGAVSPSTSQDQFHGLGPCHQCQGEFLDWEDLDLSSLECPPVANAARPSSLLRRTKNRAADARTLFFEWQRTQPGQIRKAYHRLALRVHPDKVAQRAARGVDEDIEAAKRSFQALKAAYDLLRDPKRRALYDKTGCQDEESKLFGARTNTFVASIHSRAQRRRDLHARVPRLGRGASISGTFHQETRRCHVSAALDPSEPRRGSRTIPRVLRRRACGRRQRAGPKCRRRVAQGVCTDALVRRCLAATTTPRGRLCIERRRERIGRDEQSSSGEAVGWKRR